MNSAFNKLDLNLLKTLIALMELKNTRKVAEKLHTTQPSISRALSKLRDHFEDELFVRAQYGLEPTVRLIEIQTDLLPAIKQLENALYPSDDFDPINYSGSVTLTINGFIANGIADKLCLALIEQATKGIDIRDQLG